MSGSNSSGSSGAAAAAAAPPMDWRDVSTSMVVEVGAANTRIGFAGDSAPKAHFPTSSGCRGSPPAQASSSSSSASPSSGSATTAAAAASADPRREYFIGNEALGTARAGVEVVNPLRGGLVHDWDLLERVWEYGWEDVLQADTKMHPMLLVERSFNVRSLREKLCETVFEKYQCPAAFVAKDAVLSCFANARGTAVVYDCGASVTTATPVHDGYAIQKAIVKSMMGGQLLDVEMLKMAAASLPGGARTAAVAAAGGGAAPAAAATSTDATILSRFHLRRRTLPDGSVKVERADVSTLRPSFLEYHRQQLGQQIREAVGQVSDVVFDREANANIPTKDFHLPDGRLLKLGVERFLVPELLLDPSPLGKYDCMECGLCIQTAADKAGPDVRQELFHNIVLAGGNSTYPGMAERVTNEVAALNASKARVKVVAQPEPDRRISAWLGGSILGSLSSFHEMWMSKAEYAEHGPSLVDRKCP